jgi:hypothetical protein
MERAVAPPASKPSCRYRRPTPRPNTNFSVGCAGSVVVPSWDAPASLLTAGIAKYWKVIVVSPRRRRRPPFR